MKVKKFVLVGLLFCLLVFPTVLQAGASTEAEPQYGGTLKAVIAASLDSLDWMSYTHTITRQIGYHLWETLVAFDEDFKIIPQLAKSWTISPDLKTYTFYLREGVQFHRGFGEMKAEDWKASIERYIAKAPAGPSLGIQEVRIVDDYTFELKLENPSGPSFLSLLAYPSEALIVFPEEIMGKMPAVDEIGLDEAIGTGPFELEEWIPGERIVLKRFEDYTSPEGFDGPSGLGGKRTAYLDRVILIPSGEPSARVAALEAGDVDFAAEVPLLSYPRLKDNPDIKTYEYEPMYIPQAYLNMARGPFSKSLKLRQAVFAAIDTEELLQAAARGFEDFYEVQCGSLFYKNFQPQYYSEYGCEVGLYGHGGDVEKARRLLEEAGYDGEQITIITNTSYYFMYAAALVFANQLGKAGFNTKLEVYDWPGELDRRADLDAWDVAWSGCSVRFDPSGAYHFLYDKKNWTYFKEWDWPEMRELVEQDLAAPTQEERLEIWQKIMPLYIDTCTQVNIGEIKGLHAARSNVHYLNWYMWSFWNTWIEE